MTAMTAMISFSFFLLSSFFILNKMGDYQGMGYLMEPRTRVKWGLEHKLGAGLGQSAAVSLHLFFCWPDPGFPYFCAPCEGNRVDLAYDLS